MTSKKLQMKPPNFSFFFSLPLLALTLSAAWFLPQRCQTTASDQHAMILMVL